MTKFERLEEDIENLKRDYFDKQISIKNLEKLYDASYSTIQRVLKKYGYITTNFKQVKYKYLRDHEDEFIKDWINNILSIEELEKKYKCPSSNLYARSTELCIRRKTTGKKDDLIEEWLLHTLSNKEICQKYNICESTLYNALRENNINTKDKWNGRKFFFNEKYFDIIDDEHKAYWLGFIYADGCHNLKKKSLSITLQKEDENHLYKFYQDINCNKQIIKILNKQYNKYYSNVFVQHPHLSQALLDKGVYQNKSFIINFPSNKVVPYELKRHFIRGYFDGDGSISIPKDKSKMSWSIIGNYNFINGVKKYIEENIDNYFLKVYKHSVNSSIYCLSKGGRYVVNTFLDWLYKDTTIYLQRKYDKYLEIIEYNKEKKNE